MNKLPPENIYAHTKKLKYFIKIINERLKLKKKISVLDFGCGNGRAVSQYIAGANICYYGVDLHKESVKYARNCFGRKDIYFDFDFAALPCQKFDVIIYSDILEHLEDPSLILKNHYSLLSDDGVIIGSVPNGRGPFEIEKKIDVCLGITKTIEELGKIKRKIFHKKDIVTVVPYNSDSGHLQFFSCDKLYSLFESSGYKIIDFANGSFLGAPLSERFIFSIINFVNFNTVIADFLPYWMVSTWYFTAEKIASRHGI